LIAVGDVAGKTFLLPRADLARPMLAEGLHARGATVIEVDAYRTAAESALPENLVERLAAGEIDLVTFSSSSTVRNFVDALPTERRAELIPRIAAASIGPITSETLREMGIPIAVTASDSTIPNLVEAIREALQNTRSET
ncbi:MAG: uroporphyrinogen-III synthase, partial [Candidatus Hydrogenedentes bacterium]|nr:uroporphyrinogen-III synthase [Candidatus Hydrogenedentota bacterium]